MAVLTTQQRAEVLAEFMQGLSLSREQCAVIKPAVSAALDATDQWQDDNAASYNSSLPATFRNNATAAHKSRLFNLVSKKRWGG